MKKETKSKAITKALVKKKAEKAIVAQDNRFIYAKYDMNTNEMKFFMWIVAQMNSQMDSLFKECNIPLSEIFNVLQWKDGRNKEIDYRYIRNMCNSMLKKTYIEDFRLKDEETMKEINVYQGFTLFKFIRYQEGQGYITYQLNDCLMEYMLQLERNFTQLKFKDIQRMKSAYSIRIYNMLLAEIKQNRKKLKLNLAALQNILEVPNSLNEWFNFNKKVLAQATKDINTKSDLMLFEIIPYKTGRKITEIEFVFDYKSNDKQIEFEKKKTKGMNEKIAIELDGFAGKRFIHSQAGESVYVGWRYDKDKNIVGSFKQIDKNGLPMLDSSYTMDIKNMKDVNALKKLMKEYAEDSKSDVKQGENLQSVKSLIANITNKTRMK